MSQGTQTDRQTDRQTDSVEYPRKSSSIGRSFPHVDRRARNPASLDFAVPLMLVMSVSSAGPPHIPAPRTLNW